MRRFSAAHVAVLTLVTLALSTEAPRADPRAPSLPFEILHVTPDAALSAAFQRTEGWTGADGAHSIALGPDRALWLFGDTFVGPVVDGRRVAPRMIHNSAAWWSRDRSPAFTFFAPPQDLLSPGRAGEWYWPGDAVLCHAALSGLASYMPASHSTAGNIASYMPASRLSAGSRVGITPQRGGVEHLWLFCMRVRPAPQKRFGFDFDWYGCDLLDIDNPLDPPTAWHVTSRVEAPSREGILLGAACAADDEALYAFGIRPDDQTRQLYLARRLHRDGSWHWDLGADGRPRPLFPHAAPEMSVTPLLGGWLAVYSPDGLSADVAVRWAPHPEGPWSAERIVYRAPEAAQGLLVYGARAHPEMGGRLVLTYNCNAPDEKTLMQRASAYAPRALRVSLGSVADGRETRPICCWQPETRCPRRARHW